MGQNKILAKRVSESQSLNVLAVPNVLQSQGFSKADLALQSLSCKPKIQRSWSYNSSLADMYRSHV